MTNAEGRSKLARVTPPIQKPQYLPVSFRGIFEVYGIVGVSDHCICDC